MQLLRRGRFVVIIDALDEDVARRALAAAGLVGVGHVTEGPTEVAIAYQDARAVRELLCEARLLPALVDHAEA